MAGRVRGRTLDSKERYGTNRPRDRSTGARVIVAGEGSGSQVGKKAVRLKAQSENFASLLQANRVVWSGAGRRLLLLKWILCAAFLSGMIVAPGVWTEDRGFPTVPAFPWIPDLPSPLSIALTAGLALSLLVVVFLPSPGRLFFVPPALLTVHALFDVSRMQPWAYQYGLMFLALALVRGNDDPAGRRLPVAWAACGAILGCLYFWSGLQKANAAFAHEVFPWLLQPLGKDLVERLQALWPVAPILEASIGLLLFVPRTRVWGLVLAVAMHGFILLALGPFGQNYDSIVWPWNIGMVAMAFTLFWRNDEPILRNAWSQPLGKAIVVLVGILPVLNFVDRWDGFLSGSFYSGKLRGGWIYLTADAARRLPHAYVEGNAGLVQESPNRFRLDVLQWSMSGMNAPPYGEPRFYPALVKKLERAGVPPEEMVLMVQDRIALTDGKRTYSVVPIR